MLKCTDWDFIVLTGRGILPEDGYFYTREGRRQKYRDQTDATLVCFALENNILLLGICHEMQFINYSLGGKTSSFDSCPVERRVKVSHSVSVEKLKMEVNNFQNDGISLDGLATALVLVALDEPNHMVGAFNIRQRNCLEFSGIQKGLEMMKRPSNG